MEIVAIIVSTAVLLVLCIAAFRPLLRQRRRAQTLILARRFAYQREQLEAKLLDLASENGEPEGHRWLDAEFLGPVSFARDRTTGRLTALVEVVIDLAPLDGIDADDSDDEATDRRRATAVFHVERRRWTTTGHVLFNMSPTEAVHRLQDQYEALPLLL
jgi:hypothetical protein